jgi:signal transduction histidine kinase
VTALKEADRAKNQFLDVLSHELKTPLTSILGWTQAAEDDPSIIPQALHIIENNAQRQRHMLNDLIDVSRLLHGKLMMIRERTQLWPLVLQAVATIRPSLTEHNITLTVLPPAQPLPMEADPARVAQVAWNLLSNAGKFTDPGGEITVTAQREDGQAVLIIRDTGRGIATEDLAILFQPFRQIERTEKAGGIGIGLMLVKGIVELHGGSVFAASPGPGQGSTFTVVLPLAEP